MDRDLLHDHDELRGIMRRFADTMNRGPETFRTILQTDRVVFSKLLRAHMMEEDAFLREQLADDPARIAGVATFHQLFRDYSAHISHWTPQRIDADWEGYRSAVLTLQTRLYARMEWEERVMLPRLPGYRAAA